MPQLTVKETITKKIEIPIEDLYALIDSLPSAQRKEILDRLMDQSVKLKPFKKDTLRSVLKDFAETGLYEDDFLKDLEVGLKRSSAY